MPAPISVKPELLAPAGDWDCLRAAVANGADAVYFGLDAGFNARARATNFSIDDLPQVLDFVHACGVKAYVTLNTLVFPSELTRLEMHIRQIARSGVDAVLVQDIGLAHLIRAAAPELVIHASTQMTLTSSQAIELARPLGIERAVAPRELSLAEIQRVVRESDVPLEVFVHGALCVAYSGQCLTSESLGGRSANRGECAQACRLAYELICDGELIDLGLQKYLLSPQDLAAYELIPELVAAGVRSFKIEGRLKSAEYVANITHHYRRAIDAAWDGHRASFSPDDIEQMELSFSRGFSPGWLEGCDHKRLVPALSSAKRGILLGTVLGIRRGRVRIDLQRRIQRGDGIVFAGDRQQGNEQGGRVYEIFQRDKSVKQVNDRGIVELTFARDSLDFSRIDVGTNIWKTDDPVLNRKLRKSFENCDNRRKQQVIHLTLDVIAKAGEPLVVTGMSSQGIAVRYQGTEPLPVARRQVITIDELQAQLGRLGHTEFELVTLTANIDGNPMVPRSYLGEARHAIVEQLLNTTRNDVPRPLTESAPGALDRLREAMSMARHDLVKGTERPEMPQLHILCRSLMQLEMAIDTSPDGLYVDFADIRQYREAVALAHRAGRTIFLAPPRIQKPEEFGLFHAMAKQGADGFLARNFGTIVFCQQQHLAWIADYSLNATNELTCEWLCRQGAQRLTPSYDLNRDQLMELVQATAPQCLEVVIHQHMPMFHMEHCVFCAVLSPGTNKHNCGRPCDTRQVQLRDRMGIEHPLTADVGCRNTLYNGVPQSAAEAVPGLLARGIRHFRIELLQDTEDVGQIVSLYRKLLAGHITGTQVWRDLQARNRVGVTRGTLEERRNPLAIL